MTDDMPPWKRELAEVYSYHKRLVDELVERETNEPNGFYSPERIAARKRVRG